MTITLGIDFEHIHHTPAYRSMSDAEPIDIDILSVTTDILNLFDKYDINATFFVVSELATEFPDLLRQVVAQGHEVASHTRTHQSVTNRSQCNQQLEITESKSQLESITGQTIEGFRAPTCQIDDFTYDQLIEAGYEYSSSVMPCVPIPGFYSNDYDFDELVVVSNGESEIIEVPLSVNPLLRLPLSGAWMRIFGRTYTLKSVRQLVDRNIDVVTYSHPWEFVSLQETQLPLRNQVRTGGWFQETFERLLQFDAEYCQVSELAAESHATRHYSLSTSSR